MEYLSCDPVIPLLGICPEKTIIQKDTCTPVFTVALFTTVKIWKQLKCPLIKEWIKKMWWNPIHQCNKKIKYLGINLPKETKELYTENYKTLMKKIKDDTQREIFHVSG